jgi:hypothetical protein
MKLARRKFLRLTANAVALPAVSASAKAQTAPQPKSGTRLITRHRRPCLRKNHGERKSKFPEHLRVHH